MKSILDYITENITVDTDDYGWKTITLASREDIDIVSLSKQEFIKMLSQDILDADKEYSEEVRKEEVSYNQKYRDVEIKKITAFANAKWKSDKKRKEYIDTAIGNIKDRTFSKTLDFVDANIGTNNNIDCTITLDNLNKDIQKCYDVLKSSKYFNSIKGWKIKYAASPDSMICAFRPYVDFILNDSAKAERDAEKEKLGKEIEDFYTNSNYWGD